MNTCSGLTVLLILFFPLLSCQEQIEVASEESGEKSCRIQMLDSFNDIDTVLQAKEVNQDHYIVTDQVNTAEEWSVNVYLLADGALEIEAGVRDVNYQGLIHNYEMKDDRQLTFLTVAGHPCTEFETSLIYFLIMEWFYFG